MKIGGMGIRALLLASLAGCGGGDGNADGDQGSCSSLSGGATQVSFSSTAACPSCSSSDNVQAADGNFDTAATMQMGTGGAGTIELRVTAQDGVVFPSGSSAGVVFALSASSQAGFTPTIVTYLDGVQQETQTLSINGVGGGSGSRQTSQFRANQQFDAVALSVNRAAAASSISAQLYETCAR